MKKILIRLYKWVIISVSLQLLFLILMDAHFFGRAGTYITTKAGSDTPTPKAGSSIKIPEDAVNIKISYNNAFATYMLKDKLIVTDLSKKTDISEIYFPGKMITYYRWMSDRNTLLYATKVDLKSNCEVEVTTLDVENNRPRVLPKISKLPLGSQINSIEFSHITNMIYTKVVAGKQEKIYCFDIMNQMEYVMETALGSVMKQTNYTDNLFIDDEKGKIKIWSGTKKSINYLNVKEKCVLLGLSAKDEVFLGVLDNANLISSIKKGKLEKNNVKSWEDIKLDSKKELENFIVAEDGKIFYNDVKLSTVFEIVDSVNKQNLNKQYNGKLVEIKVDTLITQEGTKLKIAKLQ